MAKKITDKSKVGRAKQVVLRCLEEARDNGNSNQVLSFVLGQLAYTFALLDADTGDEMKIVFVASSVLDEVYPQHKKKYLLDRPEQLPLREE